MKIKASKNSIETLRLLYEWEKKNEPYNIQLHNIELYEDFEQIDFLNDWFGFDFDSQYQDRFLAFGDDGTGGSIALWFYPGLNSQPPIVFVGSEGQTNFIANSMEDFACKLTTGKVLNPNSIDDGRTAKTIWSDINKWQIEDLAAKHQISAKKATKRLDKSISKFKNFVHKKILCNEIVSITKTAKHPDFIKWADSIFDKNPEETLKLKKEKEALHLELFDNGLMEVPLSILDNPDIISLDLSDNKISVIPEFITKLTQLEDLVLNNNLIAEVPTFLTELKNLKNLDLDHNQIKSLQLDIPSMKSLEFLSLNENPDFEYIDPSIYNSTSLLDFDYDSTKLESELSKLDFISKSISENILNDIEDYLVNFDIDTPEQETIEQTLQKRVQLYPTINNLYHFAKAYQYDFDNHQKSEEIYLKVLEIENIDPQLKGTIYSSLGSLYWHSFNDNDNANKYMQLSIEQSPNNEDCLENYASFLSISNRDLEKSKKLYKRLIKLAPKNRTHLNEYADLLSTKLDDYKNAIKAYKKCLAIKKTEQTYSDYLHALWMNDSSTEKIENVYKKALKKYPKSKNLIQTYAEFQASIGNTAFYEKYIKERITKKPNKLKLVLDYIGFLIEQQKNKDAKPIIENAIAKFGEDIRLLRHQARVLVSLDSDPKITESIFKKILAKSDKIEMDQFVYLNFLFKSGSDSESVIKLAKETKKLLNNSSSKNSENCMNICDQIIKAKSFDETKVSTTGFENEIAKFKGDNDKLILASKQAFEEGNKGKSLAFIKAVEKTDPNHYNMLSLYASIKAASSGPKNGFDYLLEKQKDSPKSKNVYKAIITFCMLGNKLKHALMWSRIAIENLPNDKELKSNLEYFENLDL